jgi:hypothetical protein
MPWIKVSTEDEAFTGTLVKLIANMAMNSRVFRGRVVFAYLVG